MSDRFLTIDAAPGDGADVELEIKRSRFLTRIRRVTTEEQARAVIEERRSTYFDARHHCSAFVLGPDPTYAKIEDGQWLNDALPYGTIHRLASAGKRPGVATDVINWCLEHCESLRADTHADNKIMQHLLEKNGFTRCGIIHVADGTPRIAYQRLSREGMAR